jgi:hypothetical protein
VDDSGYVPPPAFAPPSQRVPPLNETEVLGRTSYPYTPPAYAYGPPQPPVGWNHVPGRQPPHLDVRARHRRNLSMLTSVAVIAALIAIGAVLLSGSGTTHPHSLSLPSSVDGYTKVRTLSGPQVNGMFSAGGGTFGVIPPADLAAARVGVYAEFSTDDPTMLFIGFTGQDSPSIGAQLRTGPASLVAEQILNGAGATTGPQQVDAGPLGGAMRCAIVDLDGEDASVGVWADDDTLGIVLIVGSTITTHTAAPTTAHTSLVTRDFRAAAEH